MRLGVEIKRDVKEGMYKFREIFSGFEENQTLKEVFGERLGKVLDNLYVIVEDSYGYLYVDDKLGAIVVSKKYLQNGSKTYLYLDVIHELVHIKQFMEGKELFDRRYSYVDRPTEIEAYQVTVREARKIGLTEKQIAEYLKVEWVSNEDWRRLVERLGVNA